MLRRLLNKLFCTHELQAIYFGPWYEETKDLWMQKFDVRCIKCEKILHVGKHMPAMCECYRCVFHR